MNHRILNGMDEDGVSETIGAILLVGLTVIGVAIIGVFFFSQPVAEEVPAVDVMISNVGTTLLFQHNGGDSLNKEDFTIYVEGDAVAASELTIQSPGDWPWSVGETIQYTAAGTVTPLDENVRIACREDQGALLRPSFVDDAGTSLDLVDVISAPLPTLAPGGVPATPSPAEAGEIVAESVLTDSQITAVFTSLEKAAILDGKYFNFTVVSPNSTINFIDGSPNQLLPGSVISIKTVDVSKNRISITGVGHTFFSLRFEGVNIWIDGTPVMTSNNKDVIEIKSAWIPEYKDLKSTLSFKFTENNYELYFNGDPSGSTAEIILRNVRPTDSGLFIIDAWGSANDNPNSVILGKADGI